MKSRPDDKHRVTVTLTGEQFERLKYWAKQHDCSINEYLNDAVDLAIRHENRDYNLPEMEVQRLNQLLDIVTSLACDVQSLTSVATSGFKSLLGLTRGDNYLLDNDEDGD